MAGAGLILGTALGFPLMTAGSTSIASTDTWLTWYWVFSDLSSTSGMVLGTNIDNLSEILFNIVPFRTIYFPRGDSAAKNVGGCGNFLLLLKVLSNILLSSIYI